MKIKNAIQSIGSIVLGLFFLVSGISKVLALGSTLLAVSEYLAIPESHWLQAFIVIFISVCEILLGSIILFNTYNKNMHNSYRYAIMFIAFFLGITVGRYIIELGESCGCFGSLDIMGSSVGSIIRDGGILLLVSLLIVCDNNSKTNKLISFLVVVPLFMLGNISMTISNGYYAGRSIILNWDSSVPSSWYGIKSYNVMNIYDDHIADIYKSNTTLVEVDDHPMVLAINNDSSKQIGWLISSILPLPSSSKTTPKLEYFQLITAFSLDVRVEKLYVSLPHGRSFTDWPTQRTIDIFGDTIQRNSKKGFIMNNDILLPEGMNMDLANAIISVINNATYNILQIAPEEAIASWLR